MATSTENGCSEVGLDADVDRIAHSCRRAARASSKPITLRSPWIRHPTRHRTPGSERIGRTARTRRGDPGRHRPVRADGIAIIHRWNNVGPNLRLCRPIRGPVDAMAHRLSTIEGRAIYGKRKSTVESGFCNNLSQQSSPTTDPRPRSRSQSRKRRSGSPQWSGNVPRQSISAFIRRIVFVIRKLLPSYRQDYLGPRSSNVSSCTGIAGIARLSKQVIRNRLVLPAHFVREPQARGRARCRCRRSI